MSPLEFVRAIEFADATSKRGKRRVILEFTVPEIWGQRGKYLGANDQDAPRFGYTRQQCMAMRAHVLSALADEQERAAEIAAERETPYQPGSGWFAGG